MAAVPGSYLKADPKGFGPEVQLAVFISGEGDSETAAQTIVEHARIRFKNALEALGFALLPTA
jgi:hypothetical protein